MLHLRLPMETVIASYNRISVREPETMRPRRLLSVAHSYCVALNRRLANGMAAETYGSGPRQGYPNRFDNEWRLRPALPRSATASGGKHSR